MRRLVEGDAAFQLFRADVAPRADVIRGDGDVEDWHFAQAGGQNEERGTVNKTAMVALCILGYHSGPRSEFQFLFSFFKKRGSFLVDYEYFAMLTTIRSFVWSPKRLADGFCSEPTRLPKAPTQGTALG